MTKPVETFRERAKVDLKDRERYTVDNGKVAVCEHCGSIYYRRKEAEVKASEQQKP